MSAVRLREPGGPAGLAYERIDTPRPAAGEALVQVHAAAITRGELDWPVDRLPATPSYEFSGVVAAVGPGVDEGRIGEEVYALGRFDRDGAAAEFTVAPAEELVGKPRTLGHVESAAIPLAALSAWQGVFTHGRLAGGQRVLVHGAAGDVGGFAVQLARHRGAHVVGTSSPAGVETARELGAHEVIDYTRTRFEDAVESLDLVFDTAGGDRLARSPGVLRPGGRLVSVAEEPPQPNGGETAAVYFVVETDPGQLAEVARLVDEGGLRPAIDSVFPLTEARAAFERSMAAGKRGKVVLLVAGEEG
jgi:NADPH:quinone reductase-like Zn-dependent oxidoreductase